MIWAFLAVLATWTALWWSILGALVAPLVPGGWRTIVVAALVALAPLAVIARGFIGARYPSGALRTWLFRPFWYVQLLVPFLALAGLLGILVGAPFDHGRYGGLIALHLAVPFAVLAGLAGFIGSKRLVTREVRIAVRNLPRAFEGLRIVQLSDLHVGPHTSRRFLARIRAMVEGAKPDVIALTGDQVDDYERDMEPFAAAFGGLRAPLGVFAIAGNHDVIAGWAEVRRAHEAMGVRVLVNDAVPLTREGQTLWIAGTGDPAATRITHRGSGAAAPDVNRTLAGVPPGAPVVVLAHNPVLWPALRLRGVPVTLSGHTHHGQLAIPRWRWNLAGVFLPHSMGLYREGDAALYVSPGTNYWGIPFRIGARPEVTVVILESGAV